MKEPRIGDTVQYRMTEYNLTDIIRNREQKEFIGNSIAISEPVAAIIVRVWTSTCVNIQLFLDGQDTHWVSSAMYNDNLMSAGTWRY